MFRILFFIAFFCLYSIPIAVAQEVSIEIDGNAIDWYDYTPDLDDPGDDGQCGVGSDIKAIYSVVSSNFLYLMIETEGVPINSMTVMELIGEYKRDGSKLNINIEELKVTLLTVQNSNEDKREIGISDYQTVFGNVLEAKIPISGIEDFEYFKITFANIWDQESYDPKSCDPTSAN